MDEFYLSYFLNQKKNLGFRLFCLFAWVTVTFIVDSNISSIHLGSIT